MKKILNPHFLMIIYSILVAGSFKVGHSITNYMDPRLLTFTRFLLASIIFGIFTGIKYKIKKPGLKDLLRYFAISSTLVFYFLGMFEALKYTSPLNSSILYTLVPLFSTLFSFLIMGEKPGFKKIIILMIAMAGALWVILEGSIGHLLALKFGKGEYIFMAACVSMGLFSPFSKWLSRGEETPVMTFWTLFTGTIILLFAANRLIIDYNWAAIPVKLVFGIGYIVVFTTMITFFIVQYSSKKLPVSSVMGYIYIIPVFVILLQIIFGHGFPDVKILPGILMVAFSTFIFQKEK